MTSIKPTFICVRNPQVIYIKNSHHQLMIFFLVSWRTTNIRIFDTARESHIKKELWKHQLYKRDLRWISAHLINDVSIDVDNLDSVSFYQKLCQSNFSKTSDIFNLTEWERMLSSRCGLNMKHFHTWEYSQEMTSMTEKKSQEEDPEV